MKQSVLLIVRSGLERRREVREAVDAALVCAAFGMELSVLFDECGAPYSEEPHFGALFELAEPGDLARIYTGITSDETAQVIADHQHVLVA